MLKKLSVIHPFLFAIFPILFLFTHNIEEVSAAEFLLLVPIAIVGTLILFFLLRLITKNYNKSGIIVSCFLALFFSYGHVRDLRPYLEIGGSNISSGFFLGPLWGLLCIIGALLVIKSRSNFLSFTKFLNIVAITSVIISLVNIGIYEVKTINLGQGKIDEEGNSLILSNPDTLPDIYYIVLDMYARASTLDQFFDYDNSEFIDYLTSKGFHVTSKSRSNYPDTIHSVASSLNMEYLVESKSKAELIEMVQNNKVSRFLKSKGYQYAFVSNGYFEKGMSKYADVYKVASRIPISDFTNFLIRTTVLAPFMAYFFGMNEARARAQILYSFDVLANIPDLKEPTFVFAHVLCPHPPYVFDRNGNPSLLVKGQDPRDFKEQYLDQVIFVSKKVETLVDEILTKSDVAPIIILQADTGPLFPEAGMDEATNINIEMNIFNAYYFPEKGYDLLYESITPVNSFRAVFNLYFDTNYDLLKDESYCLNSEAPYKLFLVPPESNSD